MNVNVRFPGGPKVREMVSDDGGTHVVVDLDEDGRMVGAHFTGATVVTVNGEQLAREDG